MRDYLPMNVSRGSSGDNPRTLMMESSSDETRGCDILIASKQKQSGKCDERGHSFLSFFSFIINRQWWNVWTVHVIEVSDVHQSSWTKPSICLKDGRKLNHSLKLLTETICSYHSVTQSLEQFSLVAHFKNHSTFPSSQFKVIQKVHPVVKMLWYNFWQSSITITLGMMNHRGSN